MIEALILGLIIVLGFYHFSDVPVHAFSWSWFNPFAFDLSTFIQGLLVALFFYYGWDVSMNLAEETRDPQVTPGRATFWSMIFLIGFFLVFTVLILMGLTESEIAKYNTNIIFALAEKLLGKSLGYIAIIAVLLSTIGTIETQILQFTRTLFAKSRSGALDARYAKLHPSWQTPYVAVGIIWAVGMLLILLSSYLPSVNTILQTSITAIGYQICFYLGLTGFACAWEYRNLVTRDLSPKSFTRVIWPFCSAACLAFVLIYSVFTADHLTNVIGLGGIALGVLPLIFRKSGK